MIKVILTLISPSIKGHEQREGQEGLPAILGTKWKGSKMEFESDILELKGIFYFESLLSWV